MELLTSRDPLEWWKTKDHVPNFHHWENNNVFCVCDGESYGLAKWENCLDDRPNSGADHDDYEFKNIGEFVEPIFWIGPLKNVPDMQ